MSIRATVCGWMAAFLVLGGWAWHHGRFDGQSLAVIVVAATAVALYVLRDIDSQLGDVERAADPLRFNGERP